MVSEVKVVSGHGIPIVGNELTPTDDKHRLHPVQKTLLHLFWSQVGEDSNECIVSRKAIRQFQKRF